MEANQILQSGILDILFEGKNKAYGAYDLRKTYNKRISTALIIMAATICSLIIGSVIARNLKAEVVNKDWVLEDKTLVNIPDEPVVPEPELPKPKTAIMPPVATVQVTRPEIVDDKDVLQPPPEVEEIANAGIDVRTIAGPRDLGFIAPPEVEVGTQIIAGVVSKKENKDSVFYKVEIDATFPGGADAWAKYVSRAISRELDEFTDTDFGTCTVQFIVDKNGNVSDVNAINMQGTKLAQVAVNSIRKGPKWIPAIQNGTNVNAVRLQPVTLYKPDL